MSNDGSGNCVAGCNVRWKVHSTNDATLRVFVCAGHERFGSIGRDTSQDHRNGPAVHGVTRRVRGPTSRMRLGLRRRLVATQALQLNALVWAWSLEVILGGSRRDRSVAHGAVQNVDERGGGLAIDGRPNASSNRG